MYHSNARRVELKKQAGDLDAYLASLDMEIGFSPFNGIGRARITQLINKSNQFNLTTRRYTEAEVAAAEEDPEVFTLQVRLKDIFGDNGMISVIICRPGRRRNLVDRHLAHELPRSRPQGRGNGASRDLGARRRRRRADAGGDLSADEKNALVRDHYQKLGFTKVEDLADGGTVWSMPTAAEIATAPMSVQRTGFSDQRV